MTTFDIFELYNKSSERGLISVIWSYARSKISVFILGWWWRLRSNWDTNVWNSCGFPRIKNTCSISNPMFSFRPSVNCFSNSGERNASSNAKSILSIFRDWFLVKNVHNFCALELSKKYESSISVFVNPLTLLETHSENILFPVSYSILVVVVVHVVIHNSNSMILVA